MTHAFMTHAFMFSTLQCGSFLWWRSAVTAAALMCTRALLPPLCAKKLKLSMYFHTDDTWLKFHCCGNALVCFVNPVTCDPLTAPLAPVNGTTLPDIP